MIRKPLFLVLSVFILFFSCTKIQTTDIGNGLIPPIDGVNTKDTILEVITNTVVDTSSIKIYRSDDQVIGTISDDPMFGKTFASSFFELKPAFYKYFFSGKKEELRPDSAVLILSYRGVYGDSTRPQTWRVFEINSNNPLMRDTANTHNSTINTVGSAIGEKTNSDIRSLKDSVKYGFENAKNQIRIRLSAAFAERMIRSFDSTNAYGSDSAFRRNFGGFAVVSDQGSGNALVSVNLLDSNTKLALFYTFKTADSPTKDTSTVNYFRFASNAGTANSGSANLIKRDRAGSELARHLNSSINDSLVYVQTSPGTFAKLTVPGLSSLPNSIIHRAELVAEQVPGNSVADAYMTPPRYLLLSAWDNTNKVKINVPNDYIVDLQGGSNIGTFGGFLSYKDIAATRAATYDFNLTRYVQGIVTRQEANYELRLSAPSNDTIRYRDPYPATIFNTYYIVPGFANVVANGRVRLGGGGRAATDPYRMRLRIIYSRL